MGVYLVGLASSTAGDEFSDKGGHAWPPIVFLQERDGAEISAMGASKGFMDASDKSVACGLRDVEA